MKKNISDAEKLKEEYYRDLREMDKRIDKVGRMVGEMTDGWGKFVEGLVAPSIRVAFRNRGIRITGTNQRPERYKNGELFEADIFSVGKKNGKNVLITTEVKSNLEIKDVKGWEEKLKKFFYFFEEYRGWEVIPTVAGVRLGRGVKEYAENHGFYILAPSGESMVILNKKGFKPKIYKNNNKVTLRK